MSADPVAAALASGEWKAKNDPRSGRTFYVHSHTKRSVWNLQKELAKAQTADGGKTTIDGLQADEIQAAEERAQTTREERQAKLQARASAELKLREDIERLEQGNHAHEMEIANLTGPVQAEAAQIEELTRILADHRVSLRGVESELTVKREQKNAELLHLQSRIAMMEARLESEEKFRSSIKARYDKMLGESLELKTDLSREEVGSLKLQAQIRETEAKTQQIKARLQLQRADIAHEEEAIKLAEDDVRSLALSKSKLESEIARRTKDLQLAKKRRAEENTTAKATDMRSSQTAIKNLEDVLTTRERELAQLMEADALLERNGALERANGHLRAVMKSAIRDEEALQQLSELLERENQKLAESVAHARDEQHRLDTMRRQFRLKFTTADMHGEVAALCAKWAVALQEYSGSH